MKKRNLLLLIFVLLISVLAACGNDSETEDASSENGDTEELAYTPEEIQDTDVCEVCAMAVPQDQHATQIVLTNDRALKFDDIGCLYEWKEKNGEDDIGAEFVRDFHTEEWIQIKDATFVYDSEIMTPMAYGIISFADKKDAENFVEEEGKGEILTADNLANHHWERNMEMMQKMKEQHGHDHGDHDHDHSEEE